MSGAECIARSPGIAIHSCCQGHVVLGLGPTSVRMDRDTFDALARVALIAQRRLIVRDEHGARWRDVVATPDLDCAG